MTSADTKESSAQRIQQLRERLELYNSTIAEAMQAVSGSSAGPFPSAGATGTAAAKAPAATTATGARSTEFAGRASTAQPRRQPPAAATAAKASTAPGPAPAPAPPLERNLSKEFGESSPLPAHRERRPPPQPSSPKSPMRHPAAPDVPSSRFTGPSPSSPLATASLPTAPSPQRAEGPKPTGGAGALGRDADYVVEERFVDEEVTETSEEAEEETTSSGSDEGDEDDKEDSTDFDMEMDSEDESFHAFMANLLEDAGLRQSLEAALHGRFKGAATSSPPNRGHPRAGADDNADDNDGETLAARLATRQGQLEEQMRQAEERAERLRHLGRQRQAERKPRRHRPANGLGESVATSATSDATSTATAATSTTNTSTTTEERRPKGSKASPQPRRGASASGDGAACTIDVAANPEADALVSLDSLETAYYHLRAVHKSATKIINSLGIEEFPAPLPQMERYKGLVEQRSALAKEEEGLRANPPGGHSLVEVRMKFAEPMDEQGRGIIAGCQALMGQFRAVEERKAAVEAKRRHLSERQAELQDRVAAKRVLKDEISQLQRDIDSRAARLKSREAQYEARLGQHSAREQAIQEQIGEVEALGKKVASWLHILEAREAGLVAKEGKLRRVQQDLLRRSDDLVSFKKLTAKGKLLPPPPPPCHSREQ